ncbi:MAG: peptidylprolyl isomerase [Pseudomonadota bacterium]
MTRLFLLVFLVFTSPAFAQSKAPLEEEKREAVSYARIQTSFGDIDVELYEGLAPLTTANFLDYAKSGYYDRLIFHRVIPGVLIQGGGFNAFLGKRPTNDPVPNEASNGLKNTRGSLAMARHQDPDSATAQFFINLQDNPRLDRKGEVYKKDAGYTVFGQVIRGMEIADKIGAVPTGPVQAGEVYLEKGVPLDPVLILRIDPLAHDPMIEE